MNDEELMRAWAAHKSAPPEPGTTPPSLEEMQRLVEDDLPSSEREALLDRALADPTSARELALLYAVAAARPAEPAHKRFRVAGAWGLAVAAALLLVVMPLVRRTAPPADTLYRGQGSNITLVAPQKDGALAPHERITWRAMRDAERYTVELIASNGDAVAMLTTKDTSITLPDSLGARQLERVAGVMIVARMHDGSRRQSELRRTARRTP